jgi:hypothetical protein
MISEYSRVAVTAPAPRATNAAIGDRSAGQQGRLGGWLRSTGEADRAAGGVGLREESQ